MRRATVNQARSLRQRMPSTERVLWRWLRAGRLAGLKFRRQVPVGPFVVDFLCLRHRLIVEADGPFHDAARDAARDDWLKRRGFRVVRLPNSVAEAKAREIILEAVEAPPVEFGVTPHPSAFG